jgi:hypothetical protein
VLETVSYGNTCHGKSRPAATFPSLFFLRLFQTSFQDLKNGTGKEKLGFENIRFYGEQAKLDGFQYF